jgi:hypothetical protein
MNRAIFVLVFALGGCAGAAPGPDFSQIRKPRAALMAAPEPLPKVVEHTDAYQSDANCSAQYVKETGKLRALQAYNRTLFAKPK